MTGHQGVIFNIEYSEDTNYLYTTSDDRSINVWKLSLTDNNGDTQLVKTTISNGELFTRFYGHDARVWQCSSFVHKNVQYLCSIGEDLNCCLWNVNDKTLVYRFDAMRKGSKNIWSLAVNEEKLQILTGWADGGLRRFELKHYLAKDQLEMESNEITERLPDNFEWSLKTENEKDFIRNLSILNGRIICCTNLGGLYMIENNSNLKEQSLSQKLLFKSILLENFNVMAKVLLNKSTNHWCLAIGTLKGFVFLLNIKFGDVKSSTNDEITIDCINCLGIEEELNESNSATSPAKSAGSSKIFNLIWFKQNTRLFLLACFGLMNGLIHLYEFKNTNQLDLIARLYLPHCKQRWITSFSIISIRQSFNDASSEESFSETVLECLYLVAGDKCGNLHLYKCELKKNEKEELSEKERYGNLKLIKPLETISNVTKENSAISAIYSKNMSNELENEDTLNYTIICCCKDGYYRIFEFDSSYFNDLEDTEEDLNTSTNDETQQNSTTPKISKTMLKLINKYQINSFIDLIEFFVFENDDQTENDILKKFQTKKSNDLNSCSGHSAFDLESSLKLALCFYGDRFMLWNFQLNRSLFEFKCGGANRSWDYEFLDPMSQDENSDNILFRFIYIKNKSIVEARKLLGKTEIERPFNQNKNHLCQIFHGNTITTCKYLKYGKYLLTGSEDTQLIVTKIENSEPTNLTHQFHLQGHDSVVKCVDYMQINEHEVLLVSAGGKANIKLWKVIFNENLNEDKSLTINRITHLYEFKRKVIKNKKFSDDSVTSTGSKNEKPWLYIDLKSNPDVRFMDVCMFESKEFNHTIICFACSDGFIRYLSF